MTYLTSSPRFYGGILIVTCLLYVAPVGWVLVGLNTAAFFWNRDFGRGVFIMPERSEGEH